MADRELRLGSRPLLSATRLVRSDEVPVDHVSIGAEPVAILDELAALDRPDLDPAAALMVGRGNLHRRHHATQAEALDGLHTLLHVLAGRFCAALGLDRIANGLGMDRRGHDAAI